MSYLLRKADVVAHFGANMAAVGRAFAATSNGGTLTKTAIRRWGDLVPELRARQLLETYPELRELVLDPVTKLTAREMRLRLGAQPDVSA